jgi:isoleucyl-tRNA synthetase
VAKLLAPFSPFVAEELYRNLNSVAKRESSPSVHLSFIPDVTREVIDADLEARMEKAQRIVSLVRAMRSTSNLKVRQPLKRVLLPMNERERQAIKRMEDVILEEVNVKKIEYVDDATGIVNKKAKPNFKSIGPKFGKSVNQVANRIKAFTQEEIKTLERAGELTLPLDGTTVTITKSDVEILNEDIEGWLVASENELTVALDTKLTGDLIVEGFAREFVNRVQNMRKDAGFNVTDRIMIYYQTTPTLDAAVQAMANYIQAETLAVDIVNRFEQGDYAYRWEGKENINGEDCAIGIKRVN